MNSARIQGGH